MALGCRIQSLHCTYPTGGIVTYLHGAICLCWAAVCGRRQERGLSQAGRCSFSKSQLMGNSLLLIFIPIVVRMLLLLAGDVERNPGPNPSFPEIESIEENKEEVHACHVNNIRSAKHDTPGENPIQEYQVNQPQIPECFQSDREKVTTYYQVEIRYFQMVSRDLIIEPHQFLFKSYIFKGKKQVPVIQAAVYIRIIAFLMALQLRRNISTGNLTAISPDPLHSLPIPTGRSRELAFVICLFNALLVTFRAQFVQIKEPEHKPSLTPQAVSSQLGSSMCSCMISMCLIVGYHCDINLTTVVSVFSVANVILKLDKETKFFMPQPSDKHCKHDSTQPSGAESQRAAQASVDLSGDQHNKHEPDNRVHGSDTDYSLEENEPSSSQRDRFKYSSGSLADDEMSQTPVSIEKPRNRIQRSRYRKTYQRAVEVRLESYYRIYNCLTVNKMVSGYDPCSERSNDSKHSDYKGRKLMGRRRRQRARCVSEAETSSTDNHSESDSDDAHETGGWAQYLALAGAYHIGGGGDGIISPWDPDLAKPQNSMEVDTHTQRVRTTSSNHCQGYLQDLIASRCHKESSSVTTMQSRDHGLVTTIQYPDIAALQAYARGFLARQHYQRTRSIVIALQARARGLLARKHYQETQSAVVKLQARARGLLARKHYQETRSAVVKLQAHAPGLLARKHYHRTRSFVTDLQARCRGFMARRHFKANLEELVRCVGSSSLTRALPSLTSLSPRLWRTVFEVLSKCEASINLPGYFISAQQVYCEPGELYITTGDAIVHPRPRPCRDVPSTRNYARGLPKPEKLSRQETSTDHGILHTGISRDNLAGPYLEHCRSLPGCCDHHKLASVLALPTSSWRGNEGHWNYPVRPRLDRSATDGERSTACERESRPSYLQHRVKESAEDRSGDAKVVGPAAAKLTQEPLRPSYEHQEILRVASDCLHAQDYQRMYQLVSCKVHSLPVNIQVVFLFGCGLALYKMSKYKQACDSFLKAEEIAEARSFHGDVTLCNAYLGDIETSKQSYPVAVKYYTKAVDHYSREGDVAQEWRMVPPSLSSLHAKLASVLRNMSKAVDAVQAYRNAIATADSKKDRLAAHTSLGNLYQSLGENASALTEYEQAITLAEELQDYISLGWAHGNLGNAHLGLYQKDKALHHLLKSLDLTVEHETIPRAISRAYNNLGTAHQALNELDKAKEYFELALGQAIYGEDIPGQARVYGNIGNVLMIKKSYDRAIPHYSEVLRLSQDRSTISTAYHNRGCAYYEWAESKKKALLSRQAGEVGNFFLHSSIPLHYDDEYRPPTVPDSILKYFKQGTQDLERVVKYHEVTLENIKGSTRGLTLSVSLSESNSRTFHRLQDCLVSTGEWRHALVMAEQSRARSLGELLHKKNENHLDESLKPPIALEQIFAIVMSQECSVVYISYTGVRILAWVLVPTSEGVQMNMVEIPVEDDQFDGKSLDYYLRYSLTEVLVERSFEMYSPFDYQSDLNDPVRTLYKLIGGPLRKAFSQLKTPEKECKPQKVIVIPDSYTNLIPFTCLLDPETGHFLGDYYSFQIMPSLLSMGILNRLPPVAVTVPCTDSQSTCIIGNPRIPPFHYNKEIWNLGKLPHAEREARWVAYILRTSAILKEQATKSAVLMRIINSKIIHIATHGSASAGFLAFAGTVPFGRNEAVDASEVLLYPADIEHLNISPALVVLSSCDSGRGTVKADGIIGMARAFILAGAHAVLTTLWRVPDESASVFMQLFYQFLVDGFGSSEALQKASLSLRCFSKYSQYIHWSGYQLTGREIHISVDKPDITRSLDSRLGCNSTFPRLNIVFQLESSLIADHHGPTDVQILKGAPGMNPSEPVIDFIHSYHHHYKAGIFWINAMNAELITTSVDCIQKTTGKHLAELHPTNTERLLIVFDNLDHLPSGELFKLLRNPNTDIIVISKKYPLPNSLQKQIDQELIRGCNVIDVMPLTMIHTTQCLAHAVQKEHHFAPQNEDQTRFSELAKFTSGSPCILRMVTSLLLSHLCDKDDPHESLSLFADALLLGTGSTFKPRSVVSTRQQRPMQRLRSIAQDIWELPSVYSTGDEDPWCTTADYDAWQSVGLIVRGCKLTAEEQLLLFCVSVFDCAPVPIALVTQLSFLIGKASRSPGNLLPKLLEMGLVKPYPTPVVLHSSVSTRVTEDSEPAFVHSPQILSRALWKDLMTPLDRATTLATTYKALLGLKRASSPPEQTLLLGVCTALLEAYELNYDLMGVECYEEVYKLYIQLKIVPTDLKQQLLLTQHL